METDIVKLIKIKDSNRYYQYFWNINDKVKIISTIVFILKKVYVFTLLFICFFFIYYKYQKHFDNSYTKNLNYYQNDFEYYQDIQNNFCDNFRHLLNKELEDKITLYNISIEKKITDIFLFKNSKYLNSKILSNNSLEKNITFNLLEILNYYSIKNNYKKEEIMTIIMGLNVGYYTTLLGSNKYSVLCFEPFPENYYILQKNFCRIIKNILVNEQTIIIVNKAIFPIEISCDYFKNFKNSNKKNMILCDKSKQIDLDENYIKFGKIKTTNLSFFLPLIKHKRITLLIFDFDFVEEKSIEIIRDLVVKYHIPFIFIEFDFLFKLNEKKPMDFLYIFINNGYKITLNGFLSNEYVTIEHLLKRDFEKLSLYLIYTLNIN